MGTKLRKAELKETPEGIIPQGQGWYIINMADARWRKNPKFGWKCDLEGEAKFPQLGINLRVMEPGQSNCYYHQEEDQEDFLVLSGECVLLVDGEERRLKAWDFFHCPPGVSHVFVGAGTKPCTVLMVGSRENGGVFYPVDPVAQKYGASAAAETDSPETAYSDAPKSEYTRRKWPLA
ncbi:MAG TPA: cupin domain-containing protein [Bdellovibrionota bacterium]|nr:cupin domain-containing protein [Bdellovibrionota bacterium]